MAPRRAATSRSSLERRAPGTSVGGHRLSPEAFLVRLGSADRHLEPVVAEAQICDVEGDELGAAAATGEAEADQGSISDVAWIVSSHVFDEGTQGIDEHRVLLVRSDAEGPAYTLEHFRDLGRFCEETEARGACAPG